MTQHHKQSARGGSADWAVLVTSMAGFITALDNLIVTTARADAARPPPL
jgi:hypothetical protein